MNSTMTSETCTFDSVLLDAYLDQVCTDDQRSLVEQHLEECPACFSYVQQILSLREAFDFDEEEIHVPEGFADRVLSQLPSHPQAKKKQHWERWVLPAVACLALVVFLQNPSSLLRRSTNKVSTPQGFMASGPLVSAPAVAAATEDTMETTRNESFQEDASVANDVILESAFEMASHEEEAIADEFYVTQEEIGSALDEYDPVCDEEDELRYRFTLEEWNQLLEQEILDPTLFAAEEQVEGMILLHVSK